MSVDEAKFIYRLSSLIFIVFLLQKQLEEIVRMKHLEKQENNDIIHIIDQIKVTSVPL